MKECLFCEQFIPNRKPLFENKLEELGEYLHQMGGEFAKLRPNVQTGNELVDAMLWDFLQKYKL